jgi:hypothetical protein
METIQHNPARLNNCDETGIIIVQQKHAKIFGLKGKRQISFLQSKRTGFTCDSRHPFESNWTLHSSITSTSKKKYATRTGQWHTACINPSLPSLGVDA